MRLELFLRVMLRMYIGIAICYAPWSHGFWDQNPVFVQFPTLAIYAANGAVRGIVSGFLHRPQHERGDGPFLGRAVDPVDQLRTVLRPDALRGGAEAVSEGRDELFEVIDLLGVRPFMHAVQGWNVVRDKVGSFKGPDDMRSWLSDWLTQYVEGAPEHASDEDKARRPLADAEVTVAEDEGNPGYYKADFYLRPHYQLEGLTVSLRLVSKLPSAKTGN